FGHNQDSLYRRTQVGLKDKMRAELKYKIRHKLPLGVFSKV
ncbi:20816_t:CDS:1, partial [Racocetra persica]